METRGSSCHGHSLVVACLLTSLASSQPNWIRAHATLDVVGQVATAYDVGRHRLVLCASSGGSGCSTWEWDGSAWVARSPATSPPHRSGHAMTYDAARARVVLFGGVDPAGTALADTWEWDGSDWTKRTPAASPPARMSHALAFDLIRAKVVLFGGTVYAVTSFADTWEWDGTTWTQRAPATSPSPRWGHAMAHDWIRGRTVLFGGAGLGIGAYSSETWEWDGNTWLLRAGAGGPAGREDHAMAFDSSRGRVVLVGGESHAYYSYTYYDENWEWDGTAWRSVMPALRPAPRAARCAAFDQDRSVTLLFGGTNVVTGASYADLWGWNGSTWTQLAPAAVLPGSGAMAYDAVRARVVLLDGASTWEWDGSAWAKAIPAAAPPQRWWAAAAYDAVRQRVVVFGGALTNGALDDTWEWNGTVWTQRAPATHPPARFASASAYDAARNRIVLFGGLTRAPSQQIAGDTWEWDGTNWTQRAAVPSPPPRWGHTLAYDPVRRRVILFGGTSQVDPIPLGDTWEWDGNAWVQQAPAASPPARTHHAMTWDAALGRIVVYGGADNNARRQFTDTWAWDGSNWGLLGTASDPGVRILSAMVHDAARRRNVLVGGGSITQLHDTWLLGDASVVPAAAVAPLGAGCAGAGRLPLLAAGVPFVGNSTFVIDTLSARASSPCAIALAAASQPQSLGGGCTLYLASPIAAFGTSTDAIGFATLGLSIPRDPSLYGALAFAQAFVVDPAANGLGVTSSAGLKLTLGY